MYIEHVKIVNKKGEPVNKEEFEKALEDNFPGSSKRTLLGYYVKRDHRTNRINIKYANEKGDNIYALLIGKNASQIVSDLEEKAELNFELMNKI